MSEQMWVVVKAELEHLTLEMIDCGVDTRCKETTERRRTQLGRENGADLREEWAGPDIAGERVDEYDSEALSWGLGHETAHRDGSMLGRHPFLNGIWS